MRYFNVRINITRESYFNYDIEADSHEEAEELLKKLVWDDVLTDELRQNAEIVDERYDALQQFVCLMCDHHFNENQMTDDEACPACNTPIPEEEFDV